MKSVRFDREIPVRHEVDVFVGGGGPAGFAAAVAAARHGKSVFLAEAANCTGGASTAGLICVFMRMGDGVNFLADGIGGEIIKRLNEQDGIPRPKVGSGTTGLVSAFNAMTGSSSSNTDPASAGAIPFKVEVLKRIYDTMLRESGADFTYNTTVVAVETNGDTIDSVLLAAKSGMFAVRAKIYIDCTGDADIAAWAGAPFEKGDAEGKMMAGTLGSIWLHADFEKFIDSGVGTQSVRLADALKDGVFTIEDPHLPGICNAEDIGIGNVGHNFGVDGTDERSVTDALVWGRQLLTEYTRYYNEYLPGFERAYPVISASILGIRETRRIVGDYVLSAQDFRNRSVFADEIGRYAYGVDVHPSESGKNVRIDHLGIGESYGIPYRCLLPARLTNLLVAGRCVSTDRMMQSSIRVIPGCYITGQAAGVAAAMAAEQATDTRSVDIVELQSRLRQLGAYMLPPESLRKGSISTPGGLSSINRQTLIKE